MNINRQVGIEVEVESLGRSYREVCDAMLHTGWDVERDGSLRQSGGAAFEVKSARPVLASGLSAHLGLLYPVLADSSGSWRAAVHVHVNVRDMGWVQRALAMGLAYAADLPMFETCSPERVQSNFCVPLSHKQAGVFECISGMLSSHGIVSRYGKYSSVNVGRMHDLGTIEFRHMRTPECGDSVREVRDALEKIKRYALTCASIVQHASTACRGREARSLGRGDALAGAFIELVDTMQHAFVASMNSIPLYLDREAVGEVVTLFAGMRSYDPVDIDMASLVSVSDRPDPVILRGHDPDELFDISDVINELEEEPQF